MSLPEQTLEKLSIINRDYEGEYTTFVYFVNKDLVKPGEEPPLLAVVIPTGTFSSKSKAEAHRDKVSAETGAYTSISCATNHAFPISANPSTHSVGYKYDSTKSVEEIEKSIQSAKRREAEIKARHLKEVKERDDSDTLSYLINKIYLYSTSSRRLESMLQQVEECKRASVDNRKLIEEYFSKHPEAINIWKEEAYSRLKERGELHLYTIMETSMKEFGI